MAQRMESVAPPGGVMLSASTARLVDGAAALGEPELVQIKGADEPVAARRLLGMGERHRADRACRVESGRVGGGRCPPLRACWTVQSTATALWSVWWGHRASARAVWCARWRRWRPRRGVEVFTAFCESHTSQVPFHAVARLLRAATGVEVSTSRPPAIECATGFPTQTPRIWLLFDDLLGIADPKYAYRPLIPMPVGGG